MTAVVLRVLPKSLKYSRPCGKISSRDAGGLDGSFTPLLQKSEGSKVKAASVKPYYFTANAFLPGIFGSRQRIIVPGCAGIGFICKAHGRLHIEICGLPCNTADGPKIKQDGAIIFCRGP
jgi:hypothetical protein